MIKTFRQMDPFREDFNEKEALLSCPCPFDVAPSTSVESFESELMKNDPEIFQALMRIEDGEFASLSAVPHNLTGTVSKRERLKRLSKVCADGATPTVPKPIKQVKRKVKQITTDEGKAFACVSGTLFKCFERWVSGADRVNVKLRANAALRTLQEPNRLLQGIIVAYDKHWNLIMRDVDEIYTPAVRLKKVQASARAMPHGVVYTANLSGNQYIMQRHLKCSFITGSSIICVYKNDNL